MNCNGAEMQIPKTYTHYAAVALFFFFGIKTLYDAFFKQDDVSALYPTWYAGNGFASLAGNVNCTWRTLCRRKNLSSNRSSTS